MLKSTITGEPFFEGGRISAINQVDLRLANIGCEQFIYEIAPHAALKTRGKNFRAQIHFKRGPPSGLPKKMYIKGRRSRASSVRQVQGQPTVLMRITQPAKIDRNKGVD